MLGAGGADLLLRFRESTYTLGTPRLLAPLLRSSLGGADRIFALALRPETEMQPGGFAGGFSIPGERIELRGYDPASLRLIFASGLVSVDRNARVEARILGQRGATIWVHIGGIAAVSAVDGRLLADPAGLAQRNRDLDQRIPTALSAFRFEGELEFTDMLGQRWRINSRDFRAERLFSPRLRTEDGWAVPREPRATPPTRLGQARIESDWFGLNDAIQVGFDARRVLARWGETGGAHLWRARLASATASPGAAPAPVAPAKPGEAAAAIAQATPRPEQRLSRTEILNDARRVAVADAPLHEASFLDAGVATAALRPPGPPALLLLYRQEPQGALHLARIAADGSVAWRAALGLDAVASVLPGEPVLVLEGSASGVPARRLLVAVDLMNGAVSSLDPVA